MNNIESVLISIIIPVYNVEKYIAQCIICLVNQTYTNIEVILVDDGSKDKSGEICDEFSAKDSRIKVIHKKNGGIAAARNDGLAESNGEYAVFIDSDDIVSDEMVELLYKSLVKENADTVIGGYKQINSQNEILNDYPYEETFYSGDDVKKLLLPRFIGSPSYKTDSYISVVWGKMFSMKIIKENHLQFISEREILSEDLVFLMDYLYYAENVKAISESGYMYRMNEASITKAYRKGLFENCINFYNYTYKKINDFNLGEEAVERLHKRMFVYCKSCINNEMPWISSESFSVRIGNISKLCESKLINSIIQSYPIKNLNMKQRIYVNLIKYRLSYIIYMCARFRLM